MSFGELSVGEISVWGLIALLNYRTFSEYVIVVYRESFPAKFKCIILYF